MGPLSTVQDEAADPKWADHLVLFMWGDGQPISNMSSWAMAFASSPAGSGA